MTDIIVKDIKNGSEYYYGWSAEVSAEDVSYDNSSSGATADNVQDAIDEVNSKLWWELNEWFTLYVNNTWQTDSQTLTATADEYVVIEKYSWYNLNVDIWWINVFTFNGSYVVDKKITCFVKKWAIFTVSTTASANNVWQATVSFI